MKYITLTFDDGREDNYTYAYPILKQNHVPATLFVTTGFVDGTWQKPEGQWRSVSGALSKKQLHEMSDNGWEIGLHGDKHVTTLEDWKVALNKLSEWGLFDGKVSFSVPNSFKAENELARIINDPIGQKISFIREGRGINTGGIYYRLLYALYNYLGMQWAYNRFNIPSCNRVTNCGFGKKVYSIVIKRNDSPKMICDFIEQIPDEAWVIFMLHSVLPEDDELFLADEWTWSNENLEKFVKTILSCSEQSKIKIATFRDMEVLRNG